MMWGQLKMKGQTQSPARKDLRCKNLNEEGREEIIVSHLLSYVVLSVSRL